MIIRKGQVLGSVHHAVLKALAEKKAAKKAPAKKSTKKAEKTPGDLVGETSEKWTGELESDGD